MSELEKALGQYDLYYLIMEDEDPERVLYLAIAQTVFEGFFSEEICQILLRKKSINLIIFDSETEEIVQWIH